MKKETLKNKQNVNNKYKEFRNGWAHGHDDDFLMIIENLGTEMGISITLNKPV